MNMSHLTLILVSLISLNLTAETHGESPRRQDSGDSYFDTSTNEAAKLACEALSPDKCAQHPECFYQRATGYCYSFADTSGYKYNIADLTFLTINEGRKTGYIKWMPHPTNRGIDEERLIFHRFYRFPFSKRGMVGNLEFKGERSGKIINVYVDKNGKIVNADGLL